MATYAGKVRSTAVDGGTIRLDSRGRISAGGIMEPFSAGTKGGAPSVFYVDGSVTSSGNGLGWLSAFKTVAEGLAACHVYTETTGNQSDAHRATLYICGELLNEDLVILASNTDIIGVGSAYGLAKPILYGSHVPVTTQCSGTSWYNMQFQNEAASNHWTLTSVSSFIKFIGCTFAAPSLAAPCAISAVACPSLEVSGCDTRNQRHMISQAFVALGTGDAANTLIRDNYISAATGVLIASGTTENSGGVIKIDNNVFNVTGKIVQDAANIAYVTRNRGTTATSEADPGHMWDGNAARWCDNIFTGSGGTSDQVPYVSES